MKLYEQPMMEIFNLKVEDIITNSPATEDPSLPSIENGAGWG